MTPEKPLTHTWSVPLDKDLHHQAQSDVAVPMDVSLLCKDEQSSPALTDSQTEDFALSLLENPEGNMLRAHKAGTETMSNPSGASTEPLSNNSKPLTQENGADSDSLQPSSSSCNTSLYSEPSLKEDGFRIHGCFGSSLPPLPHLSHDFIFPTSGCFSEIYTKPEPGFSFSLVQDNGTPQPSGVTSPVTELLFSHSFSSENSPAAFLMRPLSPQSDSLEDDTTVAPVSDLHIFERDTQDFILSPSVAPQEIECPKYQPLPQTGEKEAGGDCSKHVLMCGSADVVTQHCHRSTQDHTLVDDESDMIQHMGLRPPAVDACDVDLMSVNDVTRGKAEVTGLIAQPWRRDSPVEVWVDACQHLAGEDIKDQDVPEKTGYRVMHGGLSATGDSPFLPHVSVYGPEASDWTGWSGEQTRRPPVERWSSVESWASALSDWAEVVAAPPEDITAAFAEIGAEIDALTQALAEVDAPVYPETSTEVSSQEAALVVQSQSPTVVQDQRLQAKNIPGSSALSEHSCLSLCRDSAQSEPLCDLTPSEPEETQSGREESSPRPTYQDSPMGWSDAAAASSERRGVDVSAAATLISGSAAFANLDMSKFDRYAESLEADVSMTSDEDPVILNIIEDTDSEGQDGPAGELNKEPLGYGLWEVIHGQSVSSCGVKQETQRSCELLEVDVRGTKSSVDLLRLTTDPLTNVNVSDVERQASLYVNVSADTLPDVDGTCQVAPQSGSPEFITPIAPLNISSSLICQTNCNLEGDQLWPKGSLNDNGCDHGHSCVLWPTSDGITDEASEEGDGELIHKKSNAVEPSSEEGRKHNEGSALSFLTQRKIIIEDIHELSRELSHLAAVPADHFIISEEKHVAFITLELNDPFVSRVPKHIATDPQLEEPEVSREKAEAMPHKTRSKKDKAGGHHHGPQVSKKQEPPHVPQQNHNKQELHPHTGENCTSEKTPAGLEEAKLVIEADVAAETAQIKPHTKKKKKHGQTTNMAVRSTLLADPESGAKPKGAKGRIEMFEAKLGAKAGKAEKDDDLSAVAEAKSQQPEALQGPPDRADHKDNQPKSCNSSLSDDVVKRRRLSGDKFGKIVSVLESKLPKTDVSIKAKGEEAKLDAGATRKKAYSEVVKQKIPLKEDLKVAQPIQAASVSGDPQSLCLWCQFASVFSDCAVTWSREGTVLAEIKRSAGDESRVSLTISNASHKDLGKYQCRCSSLHGSVTLDYLLTYEVLSEIVIPPSPKNIPSPLVQVGREEEDVHCSSLLFKDDFLSDQRFGENHPVSIITEKVHFGEGMHRRAFRTKLQAGQIPLLVPGHSCVLKVHNSISYGTKNNDELVQKNFSLAVEECQVQNTAREYIKAYTAVAQSIEGFGDIPEIIPIYLVHRPSNDIPYATLEEELIGDFVKYSVKDGKEINLMRRDSEAGQKCCAFQHWVYQKTEGNLLVTDMQGVGMRLTDVGIATCKKGYKGFKGNCATSFIDQFKALHQCNRYCEILGLQSLQPKAKKPASAPKPKPQPSAVSKKKTFGPTVKGKT